MRMRSSTWSSACDASNACASTLPGMPSGLPASASSAATGAIGPPCRGSFAIDAGAGAGQVAAKATAGNTRAASATLPHNLIAPLRTACPRSRPWPSVGQKKKPGVMPGFCSQRSVRSVLDVQLGAAVLRTAFRIVGTVLVGVRRDRAALAVAVRADHARGVDAIAGQVVVHGARATLGQALVVGVGT